MPVPRASGLLRTIGLVAVLTTLPLVGACSKDGPLDGASEEPLSVAADSSRPPSAGAEALGRVTETAAGQPGSTQDTLLDALAATAASSPGLDSLRVEVRRLSESVAAARRATDSVLVLIQAGASAPPLRTAVLEVPANTSGSITEQGGRVLQDAAETARSYGLRVFWALVVLVLTFLVVNGTARILNTLSERSAERRLFFKRLVPIARIVLWMFALYFVIRVVFAVDARGLLTAAAAVGVAIGFAAQDILKNIFGGLVIVFDQPFQVGDKIQVGDSYGEVVSIGLRSTRIVTPDDSLVSVPNSQVVDSQVSSANSGALDCQVVTDLFLPGFIDEAKAKAIAYQAAASSKYVYLQKPIVILVKDEFKETFLTHLKVKAYVLDARYEFLFMSDVTERARAEFRRQGLMSPADGARAWVNLGEGGREFGPAPRTGEEGDLFHGTTGEAP